MASSMYFWRSITTTAEPLSAGLMMMSIRCLREFGACRSSLGSVVMFKIIILLKNNIKYCTASKGQPNNRFLFCVISIFAKI